ncbi:MAG: endonuclease III domain-containing protein [Candidatus Hodarchaeales archaeon]
MKDNDRIDSLMGILQRETRNFETPMAVEISEESSQVTRPFRVLISTVLSSRTKDTVTREASRRLFKLAQSPLGILDLPIDKIEEAIYPVGFWKTKAKRLQPLCALLIEDFDSQVPNSLKELLKLPGVGRKTANLVLGVAFGIPAICVDTHVHRICNRLGYVKTGKPEETEKVLREKLPERHWILINEYMVRWGQNICLPISPLCSKCAIKELCSRIGVTKSR